MSCSFLPGFLSSIVSQVEEDRQIYAIDITRNTNSNTNTNTNTNTNLPPLQVQQQAQQQQSIKTLFSQNAHPMVALLVAIAVVFVSSIFFPSSLTLTFTYPPPLPLTRVHTQTYFTY